MLAALAGTGAPAAPFPGRGEVPADEIAVDLAYGLCPLFLAGKLELTSPELASRGFGSTTGTHFNPRVGEATMVEAKRTDGRIAFGGVAGKICMVIVQTSKTDAVHAKLKSSMSLTGLKFAHVPNPSPMPAGLEVESFKAPVEDKQLYLQLLSGRDPVPTVMAQLYVMAQ